MSGVGHISVRQLEMMREEARRVQVREECNALLRTANERIAQADGSISGFSESYAEAERRIGEANGQINLSPDQALESARMALMKVNSNQVEARAKLERWGRDRVQAEQLLSNTISSLRAATIKSKDGQKRLNDRLARLERLYDAPITVSAIEPIVEEALAESRKQQAKDLQEDVRRELVRRLLGGLRASNYMIAGPVLKDGRVEILATTPSGKKVRFEINDESKIAFDLNGFVGEACKDSVEVVLEHLRSDGIEAEIEQFNWHNPDRIKKGAKDLPQGPSQVRQARR